MKKKHMQLKMQENNADNHEFIYDSPIVNDTIDLNGKIDVHLKQLQTDNPDKMILKIEGNSIDNSIVNALRRTILLSIPIWGFHRSNIVIDVDKTKYMYNNDLVYNLIETLPLFDIPHKYDLESPETFLPNNVMKALFSKFLPEKYIEEEKEGTNDMKPSKKLPKIELSINIKNNSDTYKFVSTHDCVLRIDGKISDSYKQRDPICILVLKPKEEFYLWAEANLGISKIHAIYEATTNAYYKEISPTSFELMYETLGQLTKEDIFEKACIILFKKLENLHKYISKTFKERSPEELIEIDLYGEDATLGKLLATILQKCKYVQAAGFCIPHPFIDRVVVKYKLHKDNKDPINVLLICIDYLIRLFQTIRIKFTK
jgi:DNA-directed RNA polymerase subunit L